MSENVSFPLKRITVMPDSPSIVAGANIILLSKLMTSKIAINDE